MGLLGKVMRKRRLTRRMPESSRFSSSSFHLNDLLKECCFCHVFYNHDGDDHYDDGDDNEN